METAGDFTLYSVMQKPKCINSACIDLIPRSLKGLKNVKDGCTYERAEDSDKHKLFQKERIWHQSSSCKKRANHTNQNQGHAHTRTCSCMNVHTVAATAVKYKVDFRE